LELDSLDCSMEAVAARNSMEEGAADAAGLELDCTLAELVRLRCEPDGDGATPEAAASLAARREASAGDEEGAVECLRDGVAAAGTAASADCCCCLCEGDFETATAVTTLDLWDRDGGVAKLPTGLDGAAPAAAAAAGLLELGAELELRGRPLFVGAAARFEGGLSGGGGPRRPSRRTTPRLRYRLCFECCCMYKLKSSHTCMLTK